MAEDKVVVKNRVETGGLFGPVWIMGWLFTTGFLHITSWKILWSVVLWPYYLGAYFAK